MKKLALVCVLASSISAQQISYLTWFSGSCHMVGFAPSAAYCGSVGGCSPHGHIISASAWVWSDCKGDFLEAESTTLGHVGLEAVSAIYNWYGILRQFHHVISFCSYPGYSYQEGTPFCG